MNRSATAERPRQEVVDQGEYEREGDPAAIGGSETLAVLNKSEIDMQIATAKRYPRSIGRFLTESQEMVTLNGRIAGECIYVLPRGGKEIMGPSARLAEVVASAWGNCRAGARVIAEDEEFVTAQGAFYDLERNVAINYEVRRRITDKHGRRFNADMIGVTANAACSIALRNAVLKGIPKAFWSEIYDKAVAAARGDEKTLEARRNAATRFFSDLGVPKENLLKTIGVKTIKDIGLDEIVKLQGIVTAINEGDTTPEQAFGYGSAAPPETDDKKPEANGDRTAALAEKVSGKQAEDDTPPEDDGQTPPQPETDAQPQAGTENDDQDPDAKYGGSTRPWDSDLVRRYGETHDGATEAAAKKAINKYAGIEFGKTLSGLTLEQKRNVYDAIESGTIDKAD